jgi:hypothetical protein
MFQIPPGFQVPSDFDQVDTTDVIVITMVDSKTKVITKVDSKTKVITKVDSKTKAITKVARKTKAIRIKVVKFSADIIQTVLQGTLTEEECLVQLTTLY